MKQYQRGDGFLLAVEVARQAPLARLLVLMSASIFARPDHLPVEYVHSHWDLHLSFFYHLYSMTLISCRWLPSLALCSQKFDK